MNLFADEQVDALRALSRLWGKERLVLIGASALCCFMRTSGRRMTLLGFRLAFEHSVSVPVAQGLKLQVAPVQVVTVLKMVAYMDRPMERERDLEDLANILEAYLEPTDERRFTDEILDLGLSYEEAAPFVLGREVAALVNDEEAEVVRRFIGTVLDATDPSGAQARMAALGPTSWRRDPAALLLRIEAFRKGFETGERAT